MKTITISDAVNWFKGRGYRVVNMPASSFIKIKGVKGIMEAKENDISFITEKFEFTFIINQFRKETDVTMGSKIEKLCNKHFFAKFQFIGNIRYDERVHDSIYSRNIYMNKYPYSITAVDLQNVAGKITKIHQDPVFQSVRSS